MLKDLRITEFIDKTAGSDPVPGGGSISALCGTISAALTQMVAQLTIGKKKYLEVEEEMKGLATKAEAILNELILDIDRDSDAYNMVFDAFKLPKETEEEKSRRTEAIQEATKHAALVPMEVARKSFSLIPHIEAVVERGNQNAITDGCVAMMCARTAVLGALLNVRINLGSISDKDFVANLEADIKKMEEEVQMMEKRVLTKTYSAL